MSTFRNLIRVSGAAMLAIGLAACGGGSTKPEPTAQKNCEAADGRRNTDGTCTSAAELAVERQHMEVSGAIAMAKTAVDGLKARRRCAEAIARFDAFEAVLQQRHRASSAIEGSTAALRPYLYVHKGATQGFLDLFRAWFNLRTRRWGRHKGTSAHESLTGQRVDDWLTLLGYPPSPALAWPAGAAAPCITAPPDSEHRVSRDRAAHMCKDESPGFDRYLVKLPAMKIFCMKSTCCTPQAPPGSASPPVA